MRAILLVDNGSRRPESTLNLRRLAAALSARAGETVEPISLLHADQIPASELEGLPSEIFEPHLQRRLESGVRDFLVVPLFFGPSRALTHFIPETAAALRTAFGAFQIRLTSPLCPLPAGEPRLVEILLDHIHETARRRAIAPRRIVLVDHGSPLPAVNAVRRWVGERLARGLGPTVRLDQAVMERRPGAAYDFNGELLDDLLRRLAAEDRQAPVILALLFLSPGRHAGPGGDIERICQTVEREHPGFRVHPSPLIGTHAQLLEILAERIGSVGSQTELIQP